MRLPEVDCAAVLEGTPAADAAVAAAARDTGFFTLVNLPEFARMTAARSSVLWSVFGAPDEARRALLRRRWRAESPNVYRGFFPAEEDKASFKEGFDFGRELVEDGAPFPPPRGGDLLREAARAPAERDAPGWRAEAAARYEAMERVGGAVLRSLVRGLGGDAEAAARHFEDGVSTMRVLHYPVRPERALATLGDDAFEAPGRKGRVLACDAHTDSGFITLLHQDAAGGLQVRGEDGAWSDVPPVGGALVVNFGRLLQEWSGGVVRATVHRVVAPNADRYSAPFFFEPSPEAVLQPLRLPGAGKQQQHQQPIRYGEFVWRSMCRFAEFAGLEDKRDESMRAARKDN